MRVLGGLRRYWRWSTASRRNANIDYFLWLVVIDVAVALWFIVAGDYLGTFLCLLAIGVIALVIGRERRDRT